MSEISTDNVGLEGPLPGPQDSTPTRAPWFQPPPADRPRDPLAIVALVLAVVGVPIPFVSIPAFALGLFAKKRIERDRTRGLGFAIAAIVISASMLAILGLLLIVTIGVAALHP